MTSDDRLDRALRILFETFGVAPTPAQIEGYRMSLEDIDVGTIEAAIRVAMRSKPALPRPVELRELAGKGPNLRPYHQPYKDLPQGERERVAQSWKRLPAADTTPTEISDVADAVLRQMGGGS